MKPLVKASALVATAALGLTTLVSSALAHPATDSPVQVSGSEHSEKRATATPTGIRGVALGGSGGWRISWTAVPNATSYVVENTITGQKVKVTGTQATVRDLPDNARRQILRAQISVTAYSQKGGASAPGIGLTDCSRAYLYAARGSGQAMGAGDQGRAWAKKVRANLGNPSITQLPLLFVPYEAVSVEEAGKSWANPDGTDAYNDSVEQGTNLAVDFIENVRTNCPASKLIPFGYSQGAQVMGNALQSPTTKEAITKQVPRAVLLADPRRNGKERTVVHRPKVLPRNGIMGARAPFGEGVWQVVHQWCDKDDNVCNPPTSFKFHSKTEPSGYLVDCMSWWTEAALQNISIFTWNKRKINDSCS